MSDTTSRATRQRNVERVVPRRLSTEEPRRRRTPRPQLTHMIWTMSLGLYADREAEM